MDWRKHITASPTICHGQACIKGTRIMVYVILDCIAEGAAEADILRNYPAVTPDDIRAAVAYAAELAREKIVDLPLGAA